MEQGGLENGGIRTAAFDCSPGTINRSAYILPTDGWKGITVVAGPAVRSALRLPVQV